MSMAKANTFRISRQFVTTRREMAGFLAFVRRRPSLQLGLAIVTVTIFLAIFGRAIAPYEPEFAAKGILGILGCGFDRVNFVEQMLLRIGAKNVRHARIESAAQSMPRLHGLEFPESGQHHALQRTRRGRRGCNHCVPRAGSLSLGR